MSFDCDLHSPQGADHRRCKQSIHLISAAWLGSGHEIRPSGVPEIRAVVPCQGTDWDGSQLAETASARSVTVQRGAKRGGRGPENSSWAAARPLQFLSRSDRALSGAAAFSHRAMKLFVPGLFQARRLLREHHRQRRQHCPFNLQLPRLRHREQRHHSGLGRRRRRWNQRRRGSQPRARRHEQCQRHPEQHGLVRPWRLRHQYRDPGLQRRDRACRRQQHRVGPAPTRARRPRRGSREQWSLGGQIARDHGKDPAPDHQDGTDEFRGLYQCCFTIARAHRGTQSFTCVGAPATNRATRSKGRVVSLLS